MPYLFACLPNSLSQRNFSSTDKTTFYNCSLSFSHFLSWKLPAKRSHNGIISKLSKERKIYHVVSRKHSVKAANPFFLKLCFQPERTWSNQNAFWILIFPASEVPSLYDRKITSYINLSKKEGCSCTYLQMCCWEALWKIQDMVHWSLILGDSGILLHKHHEIIIVKPQWIH